MTWTAKVLLGEGGGGGGDELLNDNCGPVEYDDAPELVNAEGPVVGSENPGVDGTGSIGVEQAENEMIHQDGENGQDPEALNDSKTSTEDDGQVTATTGESEAKPSGESRYNLREKRTRSYNHLYDPETFRTEDSQNNEPGEVVLVTDGDAPEDTPQMSMKRGLREFGEEGYTAVRKEMQQLHDRKVMQPIKRKDLSPTQKREALGYLMFLRKKRNGTVKGRGCADGCKQRAYITKEESTSPTISTEAVFLTAVMDAWEGRKVAVLDVPGAFIQVDMDETVHVRFEGEMVDKLLEIDKHLYASYVTEEKGKKVMYVELLKALYGTLRAARLFWEKLQAKLVNDWGFTPNRYDSCVVNKVVNGTQLTVAWHVDDLKVSHQDEAALDEFIAMMEEEFGKKTPLTIARGHSKIRTRSYNHLYDPETFRTEDSQNNEPGEVVLVTDGDAPEDTPQMSMKRGMREFGEEGYTAVRKEMQQLHDRKVMQSIKRKDLTPTQKREVLGYLMFLKKKRNGTVKGRGCVDGRKQRAYITKEESTSPTISTEAVFLTAVVDAWEGRKVAVLDVPGAFMQVDMDETVHVRFEGEMVDKLLEIDEHLYVSYVMEEKGKKVMYVELLKALYGTLRAAQLFWEKLQAKLVNDWGFTPNRYDSCVVNKVVNGKQLTVAWHVDDLKVSHQDEAALDEFIAMMEEEFGKETPLTIARGPIQEYLGMTLDFTEKGKVIVKMSDYIKNMLKDAPASMDGHATTPSALHLFKVNTDDPNVLCKEKKELFVHLVMQGLYLSQRGRPDIRTAISFLCSRLNCLDEDDFKKLTRMIRYLRHTLYMCLVLGRDDSDSVRWWIDASYAVHPNMRGHTGATMSMGNGSIYSGSWKQKMVTRSSTESEVVGVHDVLPQILWTKKFLEDQGMSIKETVLYQDNMSSMLLERNGRQSSTKRTKHMDIRYFYVSDHVQNKMISLKHCPTEEKLADYFTKPLQGALFNRLRNHIMGAEFADGDPQTHKSVLDDDDGETQMKASEQNQTASGITTTTLGCEQVGLADNIFSPAEQDQHHENARENVRVVCATTTQREAEARAGSRDQDQNFYGQTGHPKRANEKQRKQI